MATMFYQHAFYGMNAEAAKVILRDKKEKETVLNVQFNDNSIIVFPVEIFAFVNLVNLYLAVNEIAVLPRAIGKLQNLEKLDLDHNRLTRLPSTLSRCKKLTHLSVAYNNLYWIPPSILSSRAAITLMGNYRVLAQLNNYIPTATCWYRGSVNAAITLFLLLQRRRPTCGNIPKDVIKYVLVPLVWESREAETWIATIK